MSQLLQRFNTLKPHEQLMLAGCAAVIGLYLIYVILWSPLRESQARLSQQNTVAREALLSVQTLAAEHKQLIAAGASAKSGGSGNLSRIVDTRPPPPDRNLTSLRKGLVAALSATKCLPSTHL